MFACRKMSLQSVSLMVLLAIWIEPSASQLRRGLSRSQRQTVTGELATGLTGTGTSFNSLYGDPYPQQQNVLNLGYGDAGLDAFGPARRYPGSSLYGNRYDSTSGQAEGCGGFDSIAGLGGYGGYAAHPLARPAGRASATARTIADAVLVILQQVASSTE